MIVNLPTCPRCGAPMRQATGAWWSTHPPQATPTCRCATQPIPMIHMRQIPAPTPRGTLQ